MSLFSRDRAPGTVFFGDAAHLMPMVCPEHPIVVPSGRRIYQARVLDPTAGARFSSAEFYSEMHEYSVSACFEMLCKIAHSSGDARRIVSITQSIRRHHPS